MEMRVASSVSDVMSQRDEEWMLPGIGFVLFSSNTNWEEAPKLPELKQMLKVHSAGCPCQDRFDADGFRSRVQAADRTEDSLNRSSDLCAKHSAFKSEAQTEGAEALRGNRSFLKQLPRGFSNERSSAMFEPRGQLATAKLMKDRSIKIALSKVGAGVKKSSRVRCTQCEATFSQRSHMYCHVRAVHDKLKLHECKFCGASFNRRAYLRQHESIVHEKSRPQRCPECDMTFGWRSEVAAHIRFAHRAANSSVRT
uniref:C2H2-type domain-containing protein n=1 Tax=Erythrolobus australicus TaxID=1077150 RepID=A0A7S1XIZ9_9RHOD|mmetsp:Transcript_3470/g.9490  ORF Transcript_3470/g.9490 Transcript_3470/m.9490 type:complete len:254 (+) Transcript_3470:424-1185(+)